MLNKLAENLDEALRLIADNQNISIPLIDIRNLLLLRLVTYKMGGGWIINSKGRDYLRCNKK